MAYYAEILVYDVFGALDLKIEEMACSCPDSETVESIIKCVRFEVLNLMI